MPTDYPVIRAPKRLYPLPVNIRDLDDPWPKENRRRYVRVDVFREGFTPGDDPTRVNPNVSPSNILSKL